MQRLAAAAAAVADRRRGRRQGGCRSRKRAKLAMERFRLAGDCLQSLLPEQTSRARGHLQLLTGGVNLGSVDALVERRGKSAVLKAAGLNWGRRRRCAAAGSAGSGSAAVMRAWAQPSGTASCALHQIIVSTLLAVGQQPAAATHDRLRAREQQASPGPVPIAPVL